MSAGSAGPAPTGGPAREVWTSRHIFVLAAIGSAIGLGNLWRFPYIVYQNGGGAFLIPYFVAFFTAGVPLMILEYGLGQRMRKGAPMALAKAHRGWEWVGWWALVVGFLVVSYYGVVIAWCFDYLWYALTLDWGGDPEKFFAKEFLQVSSGPGALGGVRPQILVGLVAAWVVIYLIIVRGLAGVSAAVKWTVPVPIALIVILVVRGLTLPGAVEGLEFYLRPDFSKLLDAKVWLAAYSQIFFSLSLAFGILIAYASYLGDDRDVANNAFITSFANCGISFLAGFAVFPTLGYLATQKGVPVSEVVAAGPGLAFVAYPSAINLLPLASVFAVIFFVLLLTLAIDSAFSMVEAIVAGVADKWELGRRRLVRLTCLVACAAGVIFTTRGGLHWLDIVDHFVTNFGLVLVGLFTCIVVGHLYGASRLREYINQVSEIRIGRWWDVMIRYVTPAILLISLLDIGIERLAAPYGDYPRWATAVGGWLLILVSLAVAVLLSRARGKKG